MDHHVGLHLQDRLDVTRCLDANGTDARQLAGVTPCLGLAVDVHAHELHAGALVNGLHGVAADVAAGPLNHLDRHAALLREAISRMRFTQAPPVTYRTCPVTQPDAGAAM